MFCYEFFYYFEGRGRSEKLFFCYFQNIFSQTICIRVFENIGKRTTIRFLKFPLVWGYPEAFKMEQANSKNILKMIISISKTWSLFHFLYEYFTNIFILLFSDPDLDIQVDLKREEEEKNGRRKYLHKRFSCIVDLLRNRKQISPQKQSFIDFVLFGKFYTPTTTHLMGFWVSF